MNPLPSNSKRRKIVISVDEITTIFVFLFIWILVGLNTKNADRRAYEAMYQAAVNNNFFYAEVGYLLLCKFFGVLGFDYQQFLAVYSFIALLLIAKYVKKNTDNVAFVLIIYFIFPFLFDAVQIRNLMVEGIILYATTFLKEKSIRNIITYIVLVGIAMTQHVVAIVYLLFLLVFIPNKKKLWIISVLIGIFAVLFSKWIIAVVLPQIYSNRINYVFNNISAVNTTIIKYVAFEIVAVFLALTAIHLKKNVDNYEEYKILMDAVDINERLIITSCAFIPLIAIDGDYFRIFRNCFLIIYCTIMKKKLYTNRNIYFFFIIILLAFVTTGWKANFAPGIYFYDTITYPIFHENIIFKLFDN